jgi:DNA polymerase-1
MELFDTQQYAAPVGQMKRSFKTKKQTAVAIAEAVRTLEWPDNYVIANTESKIEALARDIEATGEFIFDVETTGLNAWRDDLLCMSAWANGTGYVIPIEHRLLSVIDKGSVKKHLAPFFVDPDIKRSNHNIKFDMHFIEQQLGIECGPAYCDTLVQSQVINPDTQVAHGLKELCAAYGLAEATGNYTAQFGKTAWSYIDPKLACAYAIKDCELVDKLMKEQAAVLSDPDLKKLDTLFWKLEMPMLNLTYRMERTGMRIDPKYFNDVLRPTVYTEWNKAIEPLRPFIEPHLKYCDGESVEKVLESPTKLGKVFFDKLGIPLIKFVTLKRDPETKEWTLRSLDKEAIAGLQKTIPVMKLLGDYRKWATVKKMFVDALPEKVSESRVHPTMNPIGAATGRMSLSDPNLQQIPSRMGPLVRNLFIPEPGNIFMSADFSGQEMRILAHYSNDPKLVDFYTNPTGLDIYSRVALDAFDDDAFAKSGTNKTKFAKMAKSERKGINVYTSAKSLVLGLGYGMGPAKYARSTGKSLADGKKDYAAYHETYPGVKRFQDEQISFTKNHGYITTLIGRRRPLPFIYATNDGGKKGSAERAAMNTPIQGSAADMVKLAALKVNRLLLKEKWPVRIVLLIHDEILFEMPIAWAKANPAAIKSITDTMCAALPLNVPMESSATFEERWGSEREIDDMDEILEDMAA